jgi:hypothetical protein
MAEQLPYDNHKKPGTAIADTGFHVSWVDSGEAI